MIDDEEKMVPRIRFRGFGDVWEQRRLTEVAKRVTRKNSKLQTSRPLTISAEYGLIDQTDYFNKTVASANLRGYILLLRGEFAYNKSYSKGYPCGTVKQLKKYKSGAVSTLYIAFQSDTVNSRFLAQYYETSTWHREVLKIATEGARNHGLLNISPTDFMNTVLTLPCDVAEQDRIGNVLTNVNDLIVANEKKILQLKRLKVLLLQKLFAQDWRFEGFKDPWEQRKLNVLAEFYSGGTPKASSPAYYGGDIPFIRSAEIHKSTTELFITDEGLSNSSAKLVKKGDVLLALYGATSGEVGMAKIDGAINQAVLAIIPHDNVDKAFLVQWLDYKKKSITNKYLQGGQGNLSAAIIKDIIVILPQNLREQRLIGNLLEKIDHLIVANENKLDQLKQLKKYLMQNMFV